MVLLYAKKSDFDANGGKFTYVVYGTSNTLDLSSQLTAMSYTGGTSAYTGTGAYSYAPVQSHKAQTAALEPGTQYVYCVGDGVANVTGVAAPQIITTPAANVDTFDFIFFTDAQQGPAAAMPTLSATMPLL